MHKVRDNYVAEVIIVAVIGLMLITSCRSKKNCPAYASIEGEDGDEVD